jgi:alpha-glucosidase
MPPNARQLGGDPDWWRGGLIYQVYPRSFVDANGDGIGDLAGVASRLDHIASLGAEAVWISPFFVSPMQDFGYDVADYCDVDPIFGTLEDFDALLAAAHDRGLRVMLDLVISHTSDKHPWFRESRVDRANARADWYVWADPKPDGTPPNNWLSIFGGPAWEWDSRRRQYYLHNFLPSQPDLNYHNPDVQDATLSVARFWLERGVDGFRLDTVNMYTHDAALRDNPPATPERRVKEIPPENPFGMQQPIHNITRPENLRFIERLRALMDEFPAVAAVGEIGAAMDTRGAMADYTRPGRLHMAYSFAFLSKAFSADHIRREVEAVAAEAECWPSWSFSNHDVERVLTRWGLTAHARRAGPLLVALLASLRGTPCLYQGEALALGEASVPYERMQDPYGLRFWPEFKGRDGCRTPMPWSAAAPQGGFTTGEPWLPLAPEHVADAVDVQERDTASPLSRCRAFLNWRRARPELLLGAIAFHDAPEPLLAFDRTLGKTRSLCAFNLGAEPARLDLGAALRPFEGHGFGGAAAEGAVTLDGYDAFFGAYA